MDSMWSQPAASSFKLSHQCLTIVGGEAQQRVKWPTSQRLNTNNGAHRIPAQIHRQTDDFIRGETEREGGHKAISSNMLKPRSYK